jgi:hypothetical protein
MVDPSMRLTCDEALAHSFVAEHHSGGDEPIGQAFDNSFEREDLRMYQLKSECCSFLFDLFNVWSFLFMIFLF